jgi:SPP1 family predicted phage head-tail adaptor
LRHRVTIQDPIEGQDADSGAVLIIAWDDTFSDVPADVDALSGREYLAAAQIQSEETHVITLRWRPGLHAKQRIVWAPSGDEIKYFNIVAPIAGGYGMREFIEIRCSEGLNDGGRDTYAG